MDTITLTFNKNEVAELVRLVGDAKTDTLIHKVSVAEIASEYTLNETQREWLTDYYYKRSLFLEGLQQKIGGTAAAPAVVHS